MICLIGPGNFRFWSGSDTIFFFGLPGCIEQVTIAMSIVDSIEKQQDTCLKLDGGLQLEEGANTEKHDPPAYCGIRRGNVGHWWETCPYKEKGCGEYCGVCDGPAKEECKRDHAEDVWVTMKWCVYCGEMFDHWENECPLGEDIGLDGGPEQEFSGDECDDYS